jgi:hypothetical protein
MRALSRLGVAAGLLSLIPAARGALAGEALRVEIKPKADKVRVGAALSVGLRVENVSKEPVSFRVMSCSWNEHWRASSDRVRLDAWDCFRNVRVTVTLKPGEAYEKSIDVFVGRGEPGESVAFKLGFTPMDAKQPVWSNEVKVALAR